MARPSPRLFVAGDLAEGGAVLLSAEQAHYLRNVLRLGVGDAVSLFNGRDGEWAARLDHVGRNGATAIAEARLREQAAGPDVRLCFAPVKKAAVDAIAEKATELGAARLTPVLTAHTDVARVNVDRLRAHAIEAAEQCERLDAPSVDQPVTLDRLLAGWPADRPLILCANRATPGLSRRWQRRWRGGRSGC